MVRRILTELEGEDAIVKEVEYHWTCFTLYVNKQTLRKIQDEAVDDDLRSENSDAKQLTFSKLVDLEESVLADTTRVTDMTEICSKYNGYLAELGVPKSLHTGPLL